MASNLTKLVRRVGHPTRLILVLSVLVVAASVTLAVIVVSGNETSPETGSDDRLVSGVGMVDDGTADSAETGTTGTTLDAAVVLATEEPLQAAVAEACQQFRSGATVADFAVWFESGWGGSDAEAERVFREVIEEALTEACPEVVPSD